MGRSYYPEKLVTFLISIHPSRVGWDSWDQPGAAMRFDFNPPIPCGMGPVQHSPVAYVEVISIHPSRVGWDIDILSPILSCRISIHPSRVGWDRQGYRKDGFQNISIHPSRVGWDLPTRLRSLRATLFQSTHPVWDGTKPVRQCHHAESISIHPSRVGWDETTPETMLHNV